LSAAKKGVDMRRWAAKFISGSLDAIFQIRRSFSLLTSNLYAPTLREMPSDAEIKSHRLMLRAGMIRKAAGGVYTYLPLAWRTILR